MHPVQHARLALSLIAALSACTAGHEGSPDADPVREPAPAEVTNPMANFARLVSGEWRMTSRASTAS